MSKTHYYICREIEGGEAILAISDNPSCFAESSNQFESGWHSTIPAIPIDPDDDCVADVVFVEEITEAEFKNIESFKLVPTTSSGYQLKRIFKGSSGQGGAVQMQAGTGGSSGVGGGAISITAGNGVAGAGAGAGGGASSQGGI